MRIAYFTAGDGGAGHLVRGLAIGRGLARAGFSGEYRIMAPPLVFPAAAALDYTRIPTARAPAEQAALLDPTRACTTALAEALIELAPDLVLVDMFWTPLRHILPRLGCEAWLLLRDCSARWLAGSPQVRFAPEQYRRVIAIEPMSIPEITDSLDPIVICNPDECHGREQLRERFAVPPGRPTVLVTHAGMPGEFDALLELAPDGHRIDCDLFAADAPFPVAPWLPTADFLLCGAGYNSYWEARWLRAGAQRTLPFARPHPNEHNRVARQAGHAMRRNGADRLADWIARA